MSGKERNSFNPTHLVELGLFREGEHADEHILATAPNGERVELDVIPVKIAWGTLFFPKKGQDEALKKLHPRKRWNI